MSIREVLQASEAESTYKSLCECVCVWGGGGEGGEGGEGGQQCTLYMHWKEGGEGEKKRRRKRKEIEEREGGKNVSCVSEVFT